MHMLLMQLYNVSLAQIAPNSFNAKELDSSVIADLANSINPETIQLYYQIGLIGKRDIALAPSLRVGFEMALLRMLAFEPNDDVIVGAADKMINLSALDDYNTSILETTPKYVMSMQRSS